MHDVLLQALAFGDISLRKTKQKSQLITAGQKDVRMLLVGVWGALPRAAKGVVNAHARMQGVG